MKRPPAPGSTRRSDEIASASPRALLDGSIRRSGDAFQIRAQAIEPTRAGSFAETERFAARTTLPRHPRPPRPQPAGAIPPNPPGGQPLAKATTQSLDALQLYSRARQLNAVGDRAGAAKLLRAALQIDADFAMAHLFLGGILGGDGDVAAAREHIERAYALRETLTGLERHYVEIDYYEILGDYDKALTGLETLVGLYPSDLRARRRLAAAYDNAADFPSAIRELRAALKPDPLDGQGSGHLAPALGTIGRRTRRWRRSGSSREDLTSLTSMFGRLARLSLARWTARGGFTR